MEMSRFADQGVTFHALGEDDPRADLIVFPTLPLLCHQLILTSRQPSKLLDKSSPCVACKPSSFRHSIV